jgi:hypothetical protein
VIADLGEPFDRFPNGQNEGLNYRYWQLEFVRDHLVTRTRANIRHPPGKRLHGKKLTAAVLGFPIGAKIGRVRAKLGMPEMISESLEGQNERNILLIYGPWQLTFVNGHLEQATK